MPTQEDINNAQIMQNMLMENATPEMEQAAQVVGMTPQLKMALEAKYLEGIKQQKQNITDTEQELKDIAKRKEQIDLTPLAALVDSWTGSNLAPYAKPGFTSKEKDTLLKTYRQLLSNQKQELTQAEIALLKTKGEFMLAGGKGSGLTPGQIKADQSFGKDYNDYVAQGGFSTAKRNLDQLKTVRDALASGQQLTGITVGYNPLRKLTNQASVQAQQMVEEAVQSGLRQTLGAQFTQKEGEQFLARAYDPKLSPELNVQKLNNAIAALEAMYAKKEDAVKHFEAYGTLKEFKGSLPSTNDTLSNYRNKTQKTREEMIAELQGISPEEMQAMLAGQ